MGLVYRSDGSPVHGFKVEGSCVVENYVVIRYRSYIEGNDIVCQGLDIVVWDGHVSGTHFHEVFLRQDGREAPDGSNVYMLCDVVVRCEI